MRLMKRSSVDLRTENVAETRCQETAKEQNTNDDENLNKI